MHKCFSPVTKAGEVECKVRVEEGSLGFCKANPGLISVSVSFDLKVTNAFTLVIRNISCWLCCMSVMMLFTIPNIVNSEQDMK